MKIIIPSELFLTLEEISRRVYPQEFSGFGFVRKEDKDLVVYDVIILDVGSTGYTEISAKEMYKLSQREDASAMKLWLHRHPIGNGVPGPQNWSGTDNATIRDTPLGGIPSLVKWSASMVRTPSGWVGRVDNHLKNTTIHCEVASDFNLRMDLISIADTLFDKYSAKKARIQHLEDMEFVQGELPFVNWDDEELEYEGVDPLDELLENIRPLKRKPNKWFDWSDTRTYENMVADAGRYSYINGNDGYIYKINSYGDAEEMYEEDEFLWRISA